MASLLRVVDCDGGFHGDHMGDLMDGQVLVVSHIDFDVLCYAGQAGGDVPF